MHGGRINDDLTTQAIQDLNFRDTGYPYRMRLGAIQDVAVDILGMVVSPSRSTGRCRLHLPATWYSVLADIRPGETTDADGGYRLRKGRCGECRVLSGRRTRQAAFDSAKCNVCHKRLQEHGSNRNGNLEFCLMCHNGDAAVCQSNPDPLDGSCPAGKTQ